jgi:hypothetical protein
VAATGQRKEILAEPGRQKPLLAAALRQLPGVCVFGHDPTGSVGPRNLQQASTSADRPAANEAAGPLNETVRRTP